MNNFTTPLLEWFDLYGRKDLPWQNPRTPYRVWVSEIMLQQTQVKTALPYFERFITRFPSLKTLSNATVDEVLSYWSGLGYYSRGRNLHKTAQLLCDEYQGIFPQTLSELTQLPGIGPSTAAAIASLAFQQPTPILDGNVKRVLARHFMLKGVPNNKTNEKQFLDYAAQCMSQTRCADYTQAIMDLGALCCKPKRPHCEICPLQQTCLAYQNQCIDAYPERGAKKSLPTKHANFFLFYRSTAQEELSFYLEKRPNHGIWGGLWCLPHCPATETRYLEDTFELSEVNPLLFHSLKHTFTHFHLEIEAHAIALNNTPPSLHHEQWFTSHQLFTLGIPKPVRTLIMRFLEHQPMFPR